jgi:hypothetical protein
LNDFSNCTFDIRSWLVVTFINFFVLQVLFILQLIMRPRIKFYVSLFIFLIFVPYELIFNLVGNFSLPRLNVNPTGTHCVSYI